MYKTLKNISSDFQRLKVPEISLWLTWAECKVELEQTKREAFPVNCGEFFFQRHKKNQQNTLSEDYRALISNVIV